MSPFFVKKLMTNIIDFNVPGADLLKGKLELTDHWAREVLEVADLASIEKNPSIASLLRFFYGPRLIMDFAYAIPKMRVIAILGRNIQKMEGLLILARKAMEDPSSPQLDHGEYPPMVRNIAYLRVEALKDRIKKVQRDYYRLSLLKN
ncbi:hypothetical protein AMTRI_Chr01g131020 [Amborella trichopoda]